VVQHRLRAGLPGMDQYWTNRIASPSCQMHPLLLTPSLRLLARRGTSTLDEAATWMIREEHKGAFLHQRRAVCVVGRVDAWQDRSGTFHTVPAVTVAPRLHFQIPVWRYITRFSDSRLSADCCLHILRCPRPLKLWAGGAQLQLHRMPETPHLIHS
jgi:hypothetical protein